MFIFFLTVGIIFILLAVCKLKKMNIKIEKSYNAVITRCEEFEKEYEDHWRKYYDISLEIESDNGTVMKDFRSECYYPVGSEHDVYFESQDDKIVFTDKLKSDRNYGVINYLIVAGIFVIMAIGSMFIEETLDIFILLGFSFFCTLALAGIGVCFYGFVLMPLKHKKEMEYCSYVSGEIIKIALIKNKSSRRRMVSRSNRVYYSHKPVYEFYDNGVRKTILTAWSSTISKVGDKGVIIINRRTGKAYCEDDYKDFRMICLYCGMVGIVTLFSVVTMMF